jgi:hypothetical protein
MVSNPRAGSTLAGSHAIQSTLCRRSMSTPSTKNPVFKPMFNAIFSERVSAQPDWRKVESNTSSQVESENSRSTIVTRQSRKTNSDTTVRTSRHIVRKRTTRLSVKTKPRRQTGGTQVWMNETTW